MLSSQCACMENRMAKHTFGGDMQRSQKEKNNGNSLMFQTLPNSFELSKNCKTSETQGHRETSVLHTTHILIFDNNQTFKNHTQSLIPKKTKNFTSNKHTISERNFRF